MSDEKTITLTQEEIEQIRKSSQEEADTAAEKAKEQEQKNKDES